MIQGNRIRMGMQHRQQETNVALLRQINSFETPHELSCHQTHPSIAAITSMRSLNPFSVTSHLRFRLSTISPFVVPLLRHAMFNFNSIACGGLSCTQGRVLTLSRRATGLCQREKLGISPKMFCERDDDVSTRFRRQIASYRFYASRYAFSYVSGAPVDPHLTWLAFLHQNWNPRPLRNSDGCVRLGVSPSTIELRTGRMLLESSNLARYRN